jgi:hypothetical protein
MSQPVIWSPEGFASTFRAFRPTILILFFKAVIMINTSIFLKFGWKGEAMLPLGGCLLAAISSKGR